MQKYLGNTTVERNSTIKLPPGVGVELNQNLEVIDTEAAIILRKIKAGERLIQKDGSTKDIIGIITFNKAFNPIRYMKKRGYEYLPKGKYL